MRAHGLLLICAIGVIALQSAQAEVKQIQCYECNSEHGDDCTTLNPQQLKQYGSVEVKRKRRNVIGRFSRVNPFADQEPGVWCYRVEVDAENKSLALGCTQDANFCKDKGDGCKICDTDECNSATSNIAFASLVVSLVAALWLTK